MDREQDSAEELAQHRSRLLVLAGLAPVVGAVAGLVGAIFRLALAHADRWRNDMIAWAHGLEHGHEIVGFLLVTVACGAAVALAPGLVRPISPHASGRGLPPVEAVLPGGPPPAPSRLVAVK